MPRRVPPKEPIAIGDIVQYDDHSWEVVGRSETPGLDAARPKVELTLLRSVSVPVKTPYGRPQRYRRQEVHTVIPEGTCLLIARQFSLLELPSDERARPGSDVFRL
jgi:hypothetical protein